MTRSYNSRRGCYSYKTWDKESYGREQRGKQNNKRNELRFNIVIFTHKRKSKKLKRESYIPSGDWYEFLCNEITRARESYQKWTWLKGKANIKGLNQSKFRIWNNGKLIKEYHPCQ